MSERRFLDALLDARKHCGGYALFGDMSGYGGGSDNLPLLQQHALQSGLKLYMKIGGCESLRDIRDAKILGADGIAAQMVESEYALEKFTEAVESVYGDEDIDLILIINTYNAAGRLDAMLACSAAEKIRIVVANRSDIAMSSGRYMGCDAAEMTELMAVMNSLCRKKGKKFAVGGDVSEQSVTVLPDIDAGAQLAVCAGIVLFECGDAVADKEKMRNLLYAGILCESEWLQLEWALAEKIRDTAEKQYELFMLKYAKTAERARMKSGGYA